ncbi:MAG: SDR family oxidoreductase [Verrucomicrobiales bacterium]|nr:SDR family oxidoreductase [Verrucomicrobiales bacterium]
MSGPLSGKVAFISGGSRGIGRANALTLAGAGADVAIPYYNSHEEAESVCEEIRGMGRKSMPVQADISNSKTVDEALEEFETEFDRVDLVVSNAALRGLKPATDMTLKHFPNREHLLEEYKTRTPLGPTLVPEQVADAIYLLCLPESAMITGPTLFVDGGYAISG